LATTYASADIFLSPGRHETFGMATLEAISCGLPVVGIAGSGTATLVPPDVGILVAAGDSGQFADAIRTVATWPLDRLRREYHAFAAAHYSWENVFDRYFDLYRQVIQGAEERIPA
jgi:alpha-1,6-mannosyltransferase